MKQTTEHRDFRERWQVERGILEGEGSASVDLLEEFICSGDYTTSMFDCMCVHLCVWICMNVCACLDVRMYVCVCMYMHTVPVCIQVR